MRGMLPGVDGPPGRTLRVGSLGFSGLHGAPRRGSLPGSCGAGRAPLAVPVPSRLDPPALPPSCCLYIAPRGDIVAGLPVLLVELTLLGGYVRPLGGLSHPDEGPYSVVLVHAVGCGLCGLWAVGVWGVVGPVLRGGRACATLPEARGRASPQFGPASAAHGARRGGAPVGAFHASWRIGLG
jgi:hypothetical protein